MANPQKNKLKSRIRQRKSRREMGSRMYKNYSEDILNIACEAVTSKKISSRDAEKQFGIPRRTILNKIKKIHSKSVGHPTALTDEEENKIVRVLQTASDFGSPLTKIDLKLLVHNYLKKNSRDYVFKNKIPGDAWVQGFLARHADELSIRITQNISKARAGKGPEEIANYFKHVSVTLKDIPASNVINLDETNLSDDPGSSKCIFRRGVRYPERLANSTKGNISLMFTAIASGQCLPLYVVYKATNLYSEWITGGPPGTRYNCTKSGWFDSAMFEDYFDKIIIPWAQRTLGTKVVICDNLSSHLSVKVVELCEQNNIKFVFIPPRSTHLTQPLDVSFFAPLKKAWRQILYKYKLENPNQTTLNKKHFPKLLVKLIETIRIKEENNIKSGFRATGLFPLNPQEVLKRIPEMQEEILSYGVDQALIDYLKETRAPKPMIVKRNKKVTCEPGQSVTASDLNVHIYKEKNNAKRKTSKNAVIKSNTITEPVLMLDDQTGLFASYDLSSNFSKKCNSDSFNLRSNVHCFDGDLKIGIKDKNCFDPFDFVSKSNFIKNNDEQSSSQKMPESLNKICLIVINSYLGQSIKNSYAPDISNVTTITNLCQLTSQSRNSAIKKDCSKVNILSNVLVKAATQKSNVCLISKISKNDNTPFIALNNQDLPKCLKKKRTKISNKTKKEQKCKKRRKINRKYRKSGRSSTSTDSTIELVDTDNSDYDMYSCYENECLKEEIENIDPKEISFGLSDIEYFNKKQSDIQEAQWIVVRFATKKSLKHFVGKIMSISDSKPIVKFVRKVKDSKCQKGTSFTYPTVDDIYTIHHLEDIVSVLPTPTISRRGHIIFSVDFSNLNIQ